MKDPMKSITATLWQCDPQWKRLHGQRVSFGEWPRVGRVFVCRGELGGEYVMRQVEAVDHRGDQLVRFRSKGTRFELAAD